MYPLIHCSNNPHVQSNTIIAAHPQSMNAQSSLRSGLSVRSCPLSSLTAFSQILTAGSTSSRLFGFPSSQALDMSLFAAYRLGATYFLFKLWDYLCLHMIATP